MILPRNLILHLCKILSIYFIILFIPIILFLFNISPQWTRWFSTWWVSGIFHRCEWSWTGRWATLFYLFRSKHTSMGSNSLILLSESATTHHWLLLLLLLLLDRFISSPWWLGHLLLLPLWLLLLWYCTNLSSVSESIIRACIVA